MYTFVYKKGSESAHEINISTNVSISAHSMAHEILRGFYHESKEIEGDHYIFLNSRGEIVGSLFFTP